MPTPAELVQALLDLRAIAAGLVVIAPTLLGLALALTVLGAATITSVRRSTQKRGTTMKRYLYFYLMRNTSEGIRQFVPAHVQYWQSRDVPDYLGGPFADRSGGLITFRAVSLEDAQQIIRDDPFVCERLIEQHWIKEWLIE